jgi:Siderophore-interacting protein
VHVERSGPSAADSAVLADALRALQLPDHPGTAYLAGEARTVQTLRKILVDERGCDRRQIITKPFWTPGRTGMEWFRRLAAGVSSTPTSALMGQIASPVTDPMIEVAGVLLWPMVPAWGRSLPAARAKCGRAPTARRRAAAMDGRDRG